MTLLDAVRWPAVLGEVLDTAGGAAREAAMVYATSPDVQPWCRRGVAFAAMVLPASPVLLAVDLVRHGALDRGQADRLARWLQETAHIVLRMGAGTMAPSAPVEPGRLMVDPALPELPLLPLAADWAARSGGLAIVATDLPPGVGGCHTGDDRTIRLDPHRDPAAHLPHELAHALDPQFGQRGDSVLDERFADLLGGLLASYEPTTVAAAAEYIDLALAEVGAVQAERQGQAQAGSAGDLPEPGVDSVLAFCGLPLVAAQP